MLVIKTIRLCMSDMRRHKVIMHFFQTREYLCYIEALFKKNFADDLLRDFMISILKIVWTDFFAMGCFKCIEVTQFKDYFQQRVNSLLSIVIFELCGCVS